MTSLYRVRPPRLPDATTTYEARYVNQQNDIIRLYFTSTDSTLNTLTGPHGGTYMNTAYGSFSRTTDFNWAASNTPAVLPTPVTDFSNGMVCDAGGLITVAHSGIFNLQFSIQFANTDSQAHTAYVWLRQNGVDLNGTGSKYDVPAKHGSSDGYLIATCNFYVYLEKDQNVCLVGAVSQALVGATPGVYIEAYGAQTTPFAMPSIPSIVTTLTFVSNVQA